jgi:glycine dehydrogenase subunit 1
MNWIPTTEDEEREMLATIGVKDVDALFAAIPPSLRMENWDVPEGMSEPWVRDHIAALAAKNTVDAVSFLGGGYYDHYVPAAVDALSGRSEFYTAYTPYQPECSQGTLQSIYEYQSVVCRLTDLEFANASLYDGGTAVFEAITLALRVTRRRKVVLHSSLNPTYRRMVLTHTAHLDLEVVDGDDPTDAACVVVQNPSFLGTVADFSDLAQSCHDAGALLAMSFYPVSLGLVKTPGEMGADIAIAEGQSMGLPLGFGGPYLGMMATRKKIARKMPGRVAGATVDSEGRRGFVLTLQAREQHIRREKATSNICSNQALCALRALIHLCMLGKEGLREVATACHAKAEYLKSKLTFARILNEGPTFNEFALRLPCDATPVVETLMAQGFHGGLPLSAIGAGPQTDLLIAVTEKRSREEMDAFVVALKEAVCS